MPMFKLNDEKLQAAFLAHDQGEEPDACGWVVPFDPVTIDADELHRLVDDCLRLDIIERDDCRAMIAVYPQAISDPEPLLAVNPGRGPMLLGGPAIHAVGDEKASTSAARSAIALLALVEDANAIYEESEAAKARSTDPTRDVGRSPEAEDGPRCG